MKSTEQNRIDSNRNVLSILRVALRADVVEGGKVHVADRLGWRATLSHSRFLKVGLDRVRGVCAGGAVGEGEGV